MFENNQVTSEIEAYILGFLYADGSIHGDYKNNKRYYTLSINLKKSDKNYLKKICNIFNKELIKKYTLKYCPKTNSYKLSICSVELNQKLLRLGISHRKTYENNSFVLNNIPNDLKSHFIRSFFDGDGTICKGKDNKYRLGFVSLNKNLLEKILLELKKHSPTNANIRKDGKYYRIIISGNNVVKKLQNYLYNNSSLSLERKQQLFNKIILTPKKYNYKGIFPIRKKGKFNGRWYTKFYLNTKKQDIALGCFDYEIDALNKYNQFAEENNKPIQEWVRVSNVK
jgi:intein-encoded DNA endonuclease-like protein